MQTLIDPRIMSICQSQKACTTASIDMKKNCSAVVTSSIEAAFSCISRLDLASSVICSAWCVFNFFAASPAAVLAVASSCYASTGPVTVFARTAFFVHLCEGCLSAISVSNGMSGGVLKRQGSGRVGGAGSLSSPQLTCMHCHSHG